MASDDSRLPAPRPDGSAPGWFPDARDPYVLYHWDGSQWTAKRAMTGSGWEDVELEAPDEGRARSASASGTAAPSGTFRRRGAASTRGGADADGGSTASPAAAGTSRRMPRRAVVLSSVAVLAVAAVIGIVAVVSGSDSSAGAPPSPSMFTNFLYGVSATSATNGWAVGDYDGPTTRGQRPLLEHWRGSSWSTDAAPAGLGQCVLYGVSARTASNVWAVGAAGTTLSHDFHTLVLRYNGTAWARVASPSPGSGDLLRGVSATSANDAWAVGSASSSAHSPTTPLILHWDGRAWSQVATPAVPGRSSLLTSVDSISAANAWAVGWYLDAHQASRTLVLHWDGSAWSRVPSPNPGASNNELTAVSAAFGTNAWAVGYFGTQTSTRTMVLHWNGHGWTSVATPNPGSTANELLGVSAQSGSNVWAVGYFSSSTSNGTMLGLVSAMSLVLHYNGHTWSQQPSPNAQSGVTQFGAVESTSPTSALAVGNYGAAFLSRAYAAHWNGSSWSPT